MKLSPLDVQHQEFDGALSGYSRRQVRDFLAKVADSLEELIRENKALRDELLRAEARIEALQVGELELKHAVVAAERIGNELKQNARREAELILEGAEAQRGKIIRDAESRVKDARGEIIRLEREARMFKEQFRSMLKAYENSLASMPDGPVDEAPAQAVED